MRTFSVVALLLTSVTFAQESRKTTQADFLVGQVTSSLGNRYIIDLGYANGFTEQQRFAVFRSERLAWVPVGVVEAARVNATTSRMRPVSGANPRTGDLIVAAYKTLGHISNKYRNDNYIEHQILSRRGQNGYDTGGIRLAARQLASQRKHAAKWYRKAEASGIRIVYGTSSAAYQSARVRNLTSQCQMLAEFQTKAPASLKSLSPRWASVLPEITGYVPPKDDEKAKDSDNDDQSDDEFATVVPNLLPAVSEAYESEPRAVRELYAVVLGSVAATSPANPTAYIRLRLSKSQFPYLADEPDTIDRLAGFLATVSDQ
ncbi:MAG: hypothetical protein AB8G99_01435 [Planctomycetaceae bacterium]